MRRILAEPKTALAGVTPESSFARFKPSMAIFKDEMVASLPFGRWDSVCMVGIQGGRRKRVGTRAVKKGANPDGNRRPSSWLSVKGIVFMAGTF